MHIPNSLPLPSVIVGDARSRADPLPRPPDPPESPAVKLELSEQALKRRSFPPSPDLKDLASDLEPKARAEMLADALDGPGTPVALKLSTLKMMLAKDPPLPPEPAGHADPPHSRPSANSDVVDDPPHTMRSEGTPAIFDQQAAQHSYDPPHPMQPSASDPTQQGEKRS